MAKRVDITEKLSFDENPVMIIGDLEVEVNAGAEDVLKLMGVFANKSELEAVPEALNLLFKPADIKKICAMKKNGKKLTGKALVAVIQEAASLAMNMDEDNASGEY